MLRQLFVVLCVSSLMGCGQRSPSRVDNDAISKCITSHSGQSDYVLLTKCVPLSRPLRLEGTWFVGFEESSFTAGYSKVPAMADNRGVQLVYSDAAARSLPAIKEGQSAAFQIAFVGRHTLLDEPELQAVVVDKVVSVKAVPRQLSSPEKAGP